MNSEYPENVVSKILQLTLKANKFAYLAIDDQAILLNSGGYLSSLGLPEWKPGDNIEDEVLFLAGYLPLTSTYECISAYQINDSCLIDVHLFKDSNCSWVILEDKTEDLEWEATARQSTNELRLLQQTLAKRQNEDARGQVVETRFDFFESLNMMAFQANDDGSFKILEPVANPFKDIYPESLDTVDGLFPQKKFPFVENFLIDAEDIWSDPENTKRIRSGPWLEQNAAGEEIALEAIALNWKRHKLLFIEIQDESYQLNHNFLQIGREGVLLKNILQEEVRKQTREIRAREEEIALRLVCAADTRDDGETGSHIRRIGLYSELMAKQLGWSDADAEVIRIAAPMHDIGKIGIPDHILKKPGKLTESEFDIMKLHAEIGARILSNSSSPLVQMAREICLGHHERWDGSGYPKGSKGTDIAISGRIVAIVDVFDALIHKRVYKDEMPVDKAIELMLQGRGSHFDPELLDLFFSMKSQMTEIAFDFKNPIGEDTPDDITLIGDSHQQQYRD